jgi:hypothetical protein
VDGEAVIALKSSDGVTESGESVFGGTTITCQFAYITAIDAGVKIYGLYNRQLA